MKKLIKAGILSEDDENANKAMAYALTVMKAPVDQKIGLSAAGLVLQYTRSKPVAKSEISISKAEEWLSAVTADHAKISEDEPEDNVGGEEEAS